MNNPSQVPTYNADNLDNNLSQYNIFIESIDAIYKNYHVSSSSHLAAKVPNTYYASNLKDEDLNSAWIEGQKDDGKEEKIEMQLEQPIDIDGFFIVNGYCKNQKTWSNNNRVKTLKLIINGRLKGFLHLNDSMSYQLIYFPRLHIKSGDKIELEIVDIYKGQRFQDTAISELYPLQAF